MLLLKNNTHATPSKDIFGKGGLDTQNPAQVLSPVNSQISLMYTAINHLKSSGSKNSKHSSQENQAASSKKSQGTIFHDPQQSQYVFFTMVLFSARESQLLPFA